MNDQETNPKGRKFAALIMAGVLLVVLSGAAVVMAIVKVEIPPGFGTAIGSLAGCFPVYMGANAAVHYAQSRAEAQG